MDWPSFWWGVLVGSVATLVIGGVLIGWFVKWLNENCGPRF